MIKQLLPIRKKADNPELYKYLPRWQQNNSPEDLGIIRFGFDLFPDILKREYGVAGWVRQALWKVLRYKKGDTKIDRCHAICTYREGSKTTWFGVILPLYFLLVGQYGVYCENQLLPEVDYIRIRGKNLDEAEKKLQNVTTHFGDELVLRLFGRLEPTLREIKDRKLRSTSKFVILVNGYVFQALGIDAPSRGALIKGRRPKMDIDDDVENKENTKTENQRKWNAHEVLSEQFGGLDKEGITIYIGNFVHDDCLIKHLLKNKGWKPQFYAIGKVDENGDPIFDEEGNYIPDWPKRFPSKYIKGLEEWYGDHEDLGGRRKFFMEYFNKIVSDKTVKIIPIEARYERKNGLNWVVSKRKQEGEFHEIWTRLHVVVSIDPSISGAKGTSDGVVTVTGFGADTLRYILDCSLGKFDIRDRYKEMYREEEKKIKFTKHLATTKEELGYLERKGGVEETVRAILYYNADAFVVENAGQQLAWYNDIKDLLAKIGYRKIDSLPYHPVDEKVYKLEVGLLNLIAAEKYYILNKCRNRKAVETQVSTFPDSKLDILDALFNAEQIGRTPQAVDIERIHTSQGRKKDSLDELLLKPDVEAWAVI